MQKKQYPHKSHAKSGCKHEELIIHKKNVLSQYRNSKVMCKAPPLRFHTYLHNGFTPPTSSLYLLIKSQKQHGTLGCPRIKILTQHSWPCIQTTVLIKPEEMTIYKCFKEQILMLLQGQTLRCPAIVLVKPVHNQKNSLLVSVEVKRRYPTPGQ